MSEFIEISASLTNRRENMKTILDAVNELKGDSYSKDLINDYGVLWRNNGNINYIYFINHPIFNPDVCSRIRSTKEFNKLVAEIPLGIDFSKLIKDELSGYLNIDKNKINPTKQQPTYTQEMYDNGERPSIGMEVLLEEDTEFFSCASGEVKKLKADDVVSVISVGKRLDNKCTVLTLMHVDAGFCVINPDYVKPIPPKVDLINGEAYQYNCYNSTHNGIYDEFKKSMYSVHSITCIEHCTNIKPLKVSD